MNRKTDGSIQSRLRHAVEAEANAWRLCSIEIFENRSQIAAFISDVRRRDAFLWDAAEGDIADELQELLLGPSVKARPSKAKLSWSKRQHTKSFFRN